MELNGFSETELWAALRASHHLALKKPLNSVLVPREGIEPPSSVPKTGTLSVELSGQTTHSQSLFCTVK